MANENKIVTFNDLKKYTNALGERITTDTNNLYRHTITLRGGNGITKVVIDIYNSSVKNLTINEILDFIKDNYSYESAAAVGNNYCLSANGLAGDALATAENVIGIFYNLTNSCYSLITIGSGTSGGLTFKGYNCSEVTKMQETITKVTAVNTNPNTWADDDPYTDSPQDTDTLANVDLENTKVKKITFGNLEKWVKNKLEAVTEETITFNSTYISANYSKVLKVGKVYMCNIAFQVKSDADVPANTWLVRLSSNVVKSGTEVYCVLHCTDLTNVPATRLLQLGGPASFNQFFVKTNPLPKNKYYFGNCIIVNNI